MRNSSCIKALNVDRAKLLQLFGTECPCGYNEYIME
jgi:hypothetical protein